MTENTIVQIALELVSVDRDKDRIHYKSELIDPPREARHPKATRASMTITEEQFDTLGRPVEIYVTVIEAGGR